MKLKDLPDGAIHDQPAPGTNAPIVGSRQRYAACSFCGKPTATYGPNSDTVRWHKLYENPDDYASWGVFECPGARQEGELIPSDEEVWISPIDTNVWVRVQ